MEARVNLQQQDDERDRDDDGDVDPQTVFGDVPPLSLATPITFLRKIRPVAPGINAGFLPRSNRPA
jgi:hypothetical protein